MPGILQDKVIIITGAGRGIGKSMASVFAREGAKTILAGRTLSSLEETRDEVASLGGESICVATDVSKGDDCRNMVAEAIRKFERLDCAVNNAAIDGIPGPTADYDEAMFDEITAINYKGVWNCMRFEIPEMLKVGGGSIVNISSTTTKPTISGLSAYVGSKYAMHGLSKTAAYEYAPQGIRINIVLPGVISTPMLNGLLERHPELVEPAKKSVPCGRFGEPEEVAEAAAWLCSDKASYVMGTELCVDGAHALRGGHSGM